MGRSVQSRRKGIYMKPMEIGEFEAQKRLPELLRKVERGQKIYITRGGKPVAVLTGAASDEAKEEMDRRKLLGQIRAFRAAAKPGPETLKSLVEQGHR